MAVKIRERKFESKEALQAAAAADMRLIMEAPHEVPTGIMVPGGSTPGPVFQALARDPFAVSPRFRLMYTDERHVPHDSADSNYRLTLPLIEGLDLAPDQICAVDTSGSMDEVADRWDGEWRAYLEGGGRIALGFLGMGPDTHTCSVFTDDDLARSAGRYAVAVNRPKPPPRGISTTPELLEHVDRIVFLVTGDDKAAVADQLRDAPEKTIAGKAVARRGEAELWRSC
jgi:6-phosphogluconolactonase